MSVLPQNIPSVLQALDLIIADAIENNHPKGYFAALYRAVTAEVQKGILAGRFEDGDRMEKLDVIFANRYLAAHNAYFANSPCSLSWKIAFDETRNNKLIILQHLFLGMTAHIMLDLGIAAAETCPGNKINSLKNDFHTINTLLSSMVDGIETKLGTMSPFFFLIDKFGGRNDEKLADFSMKIARTAAWQTALDLAKIHGTNKWQMRINQADMGAFLLAQTLIPRGTFKLTTAIVKAREEKNVAKAIRILNTN